MKLTCQLDKAWMVTKTKVSKVFWLQKCLIFLTYHSGFEKFLIRYQSFCSFLQLHGVDSNAVLPLPHLLLHMVSQLAERGQLHLSWCMRTTYSDGRPFFNRKNIHNYSVDIIIFIIRVAFLKNRSCGASPFKAYRNLLCTLVFTTIEQT